MIEFATIARPYAKAIFELAESEQADNWQTSLKEAAWLVRQPQVEVLIAQTDTDAKQKTCWVIRLLWAAINSKISCMCWLRRNVCRCCLKFMSSSKNWCCRVSISGRQLSIPLMILPMKIKNSRLFRVWSSISKPSCKLFSKLIAI